MSNQWFSVGEPFKLPGRENNLMVKVNEDRTWEIKKKDPVLREGWNPIDSFIDSIIAH